MQQSSFGSTSPLKNYLFKTVAKYDICAAFKSQIICFFLYLISKRIYDKIF